MSRSLVTVAEMFVVLLCAALLGSCRGEPVPRDYQNNPPAMTTPVDTPEQAPSAESSTTVPEPSYGPEGTAGPYEKTKPPVDSGKPVGNPTPATPQPTTT